MAERGRTDGHTQTDRQTRRHQPTQRQALSSTGRTPTCHSAGGARRPQLRPQRRRSPLSASALPVPELGQTPPGSPRPLAGLGAPAARGAEGRAARRAEGDRASKGEETGPRGAEGDRAPQSRGDRTAAPPRCRGSAPRRSRPRRAARPLLGRPLSRPRRPRPTPGPTRREGRPAHRSRRLLTGRAARSPGARRARGGGRLPGGSPGPRRRRRLRVPSGGGGRGGAARHVSSVSSPRRHLVRGARGRANRGSAEVTAKRSEGCSRPRGRDVRGGRPRRLTVGESSARLRLTSRGI